VIDVLVSTRRDAAAARVFFARALRHGPVPVEITADRAPAYPRVVDEVAPTARHVTEQYATDENVKGVAGVSGCCAWDSGPP
jgi:transposase, IS6 family